MQIIYALSFAHQIYQKRVNTDDEGTSCLGKMRQKSLQDLVPIFLPYTMVVGTQMVLLCYASDPTMCLLLYSALPAKHQNWLSLLVCLL